MREMIAPGLCAVAAAVEKTAGRPLTHVVGLSLFPAKNPRQSVEIAPSSRDDRISSNVMIAFLCKSEIVFGLGHSKDKKHSYNHGKYASLGSRLPFLLALEIERVGLFGGKNARDKCEGFGLPKIHAARVQPGRLPSRPEAS